jgi:GT2 family glycosyltransferase
MMAMSKALVTVAVVPRERFSYTQPSLESIFNNTPQPFELVYVDGGSPGPIRRYLAATAKQRGFRLIRTRGYLSPNQARNLALREITTKYVVFVDNDVVVHPGWLTALVECAEQTGASIVGPLYYEGQPGSRNIHMAGGDAEIEDSNGTRVLRERHRFVRQERDTVTAPFVREPIGLVEFHCMLVQMDVFGRLGPLDAQLLSTLEHVDFCLTVRAAGGSVYFEPKAEITHVLPPPFAPGDYPFFMLRWSDAWNTATMNHFQRKWGLAEDDESLREKTAWLAKHRKLYFKPVWDVIYPVVGWRRANTIEKALTHCVASLVG